MTDMDDWAVAEPSRPKQGALSFDLERALSSIVRLRAEVPDDAFTASVLGTERQGAAVLINDRGLILTIGYLVAEAERIWVFSHSGQAVQGDLIAYDFATGFGLVQALGRFDATPARLGDSSRVRVGDSVIFAGAGGRAQSLSAKVVSTREFAGYWEYLLERAFFTIPAHELWGGAALLDAGGALVGIGSLFVGNARGGAEPSDGNMSVPTDLVKPLLDELERTGRITETPRPWLGLYTAESDHHLVVAGVAPNGPGDQAGVETGDVILDVGGAPLGGLSDMLRTVWSLGEPGVSVPMTLVRDGKPRQVAIQTADRASFMRQPRLH
ncbi:MAG: S1C family serine protease [Alphaproteobacteria bacterium]|nr:S1C family serine protease [Alphaproteobacteria bacterium]